MIAADFYVSFRETSATIALRGVSGLPGHTGIEKEPIAYVLGFLGILVGEQPWFFQ